MAQIPKTKLRSAWLPLHAQSSLDLSASLDSYRTFLGSLRELPCGEPDLLVDFIWHTHMQCPQQYSQDCVSFVGTLVDHDDDLE